MPGQSHQRTVSTPATATPAPAPAVQAPQPQDQVGNQALVEAAPRTDPGRLAWSSALGEMVGGGTYDLLAAELTEDKLVGHAQKLVDSALGALRGQLQGAVDPSEQEAADLLLEHLDGSLKGWAAKIVAQSDLSEEALALVGGHPYEVVLAAAAGAVAWVLSNQDLPLVEQKIGLGGGHSLLVGLDAGRTLDLAIQQVRVGYRWQGSGQKAEFTADAFTQEGGWQATGRFEQALDPGRSLVLSGQHVARPDQDLSRVALDYMSPTLTAGAWWERTHRDTEAVESLGGHLSFKGEDPSDLQGYLRGTVRSDRSWETAGGLSQKTGQGSWALEGFAGQTPDGRQDHGVRALFKWTF